MHVAPRRRVNVTLGYMVVRGHARMDTAEGRRSIWISRAGPKGGPAERNQRRALPRRDTATVVTMAKVMKNTRLLSGNVS